MENLRVLQLFAIFGIIISLAGCANVPSDPNTLSNLNGSYDVVDQFSYKFTHATRIDVHFLSPDAQGKIRADLTVYDGDSAREYRLDDCGYPGERIARNVANSDDPRTSEVVRCLSARQLQDRSRPVLFLIHSLDGHSLVFHPDGGLISALTNHPLVSSTPWMAIINWAPVWSSGFVLKRSDR